MKRDERLTTVLLLGVSGALLTGWVVWSRLEAVAYERVTGKTVSTWDAMFLDLRVQESAK